MMSESFEATLVSQLLSSWTGSMILDASASSLRRTALLPSTRPPASGALDHEIEIGLPDAEARLHILKIHTRDMPTAPELDLRHIAQHTGSYRAPTSRLCAVRRPWFACAAR